MTIEPTNAPSGAGALSAEQSMAEANRILSEAGWTTTPRPPWRGSHCIPGAVGGVAPGGTPYVKAYTAFPQAEAAAFGFDPADYPDEPHEAAAWLVEHVKRLTTPPPVLEPAREIVLAAEGADVDSAGHEQFDHGHSGRPAADDGMAGEQPPDAPEASDADGDGGVADEAGEYVSAELGGDAGPEVLDADFTESAGDAYDQDVTLALGPPDDDEDEPMLTDAEARQLYRGNVPDDPDEETFRGPIAYAASDLDALVREKLGRVSQIARELKAILHEGWTREEYASLQNLIMRIDQGLAPDDPVAQARFMAISERHRAMSRVDAHRDALETALAEIGASRDYAAVQEFDPESGWPGSVQ